VIECPHCMTANADKNVVCKDCGYSLRGGPKLLMQEYHILTDAERLERDAEELRWVEESKNRSIFIWKWVVRGFLALNVIVFVYGLLFSGYWLLTLIYEAIPILGMVVLYNPSFVQKREKSGKMMDTPEADQHYVNDTTHLFTGLTLYITGMIGMIFLAMQGGTL
jgi:hypothetical protein